MAGIDLDDDSYPLECSQRELDLVLNGAYQSCFHSKDYFSVDNSTGHIFDVINDNGIMRSNVRGDKLVEIIKVS